MGGLYNAICCDVTHTYIFLKREERNREIALEGREVDRRFGVIDRKIGRKGCPYTFWCGS